jgi:hypothetical protein
MTGVLRGKRFAHRRRLASEAYASRVLRLRLAVAGVAFVAVLAVASAGANLLLLRLTQDSSDPVGRLSPRAVFPTPTRPAPTPAPVPAPGEHHGADD